VALGAEDAGGLQHDLDAGIVVQHHHLGPVGNVGVVRRRARVVERLERRGGEVGRVHAGDTAVVRLQERGGGHVEGHVVHGRREHGPVGPLARLVDGAGVGAEPDGEEEGAVHGAGHVGRVVRGCQAPEPGAVVRGEGRVVERGERGPEEREAPDVARRRVLEHGRDGGVVEGARLARAVGARQHEVRGRGAPRVGLGAQEHVGGLARRDEHDVRAERLDVGGVDVDDGERVVGDGEEELVVERGVDETEQVPFAGQHLQLERVYGSSTHVTHDGELELFNGPWLNGPSLTFAGAVVQRAREPVDGEGVRHVWACSSLKRLGDNCLWIRVEPLSCGHIAR
jgi:hypothetical protein